MPDPATDPTVVAAAATLRVMRRTRQIREFTPEPLSDDQVRAILDVARWTGSGQNRQPWQLVAVLEPGTRARIAELAPNAHGATTAPLTIAIGMPDASSVRDGFDEGRIAERILVAAYALGLGASIGWARDTARTEIAELLGMTPPVMVRTLVSIGHPTARAARPQSAPGTARKPLDEVARLVR